MNKGIKYLAVVVVVAVGDFASSVRQLEECTNGQQRSILSMALHCEPRETVVQLDLPNDTYVHVAPSHVTVQRCGASCHNRYHSCVPLSKRLREVSAMMVERSSSAGSAPSACAMAKVEEHTSCGCGCAVSAAECGARQTFVAAECRCVCANDAERSACLQRGWFWNADICECMCDNPVNFPTCSSGYQYDGLRSCSCVNISDLAEQIAAIVVLTIIAVGILTACSLAQCYRARTGFFAARRRRDHEARVSSTKASELRQMFRVLSHTGHYDSAAAAERARLMKAPDSAAAKKNSKALLSPCNNDLSIRPIAPAAAAAATATASGIAKKCRHRSGACGGCSDEKRRLAPLMEHDVKSEEEPGSGLGVMLKTRDEMNLT